MGKYEAKISEIKEKIVKEINPEKVVLFGSYAWGNPTDDSDVDLFIIQNSKEPRRMRQAYLRKKLSGSGVPMDFLVYTPEEVDKSVNENHNLFIEDIMRNGKVIYEKPGSAFNVALAQRPLTILHQNYAN